MSQQGKAALPSTSPTAIKTAVPPPAAVDGLSKFHADFVAYLYADHGPAYNENMRRIEEGFSVKREQVAYFLITLNCVYMIFGGWAEFICNMIGIAYPAYVSVKAIRTEGTDDDTQWLIYWAVFATFALFDFFAVSIMSVFPIYWIAKMIFLIYLYLPQTQGSIVIYNSFVDPLVTFIDKMLEPKDGSLPAETNKVATEPVPAQ